VKKREIERGGKRQERGGGVVNHLFLKLVLTKGHDPG
jgi:hypothetical protein